MGQDNILNKLIGKWEAKDGDGITGSINFIDSIHVTVKIPNQVYPPGEYVVDTTKYPIWLDMTFKQGKSVLTMKGILKLINDNTLKCQISEAERSETFNKVKTDNVIVLKRKT